MHDIVMDDDPQYSVPYKRQFLQLHKTHVFPQEPLRAVPSHRQLLLPDHRRVAAARRLPRQPIHLHRPPRLRRLSHIRQTGEMVAVL